MTDRRKGQIGLFIVAIIWGSGFVFSAIALDFFTPYQILAVRFFTAFILMLAIFKRRLNNSSSKTIKKGIVLGVFLYLAFMFQTVGLVYTTPSKNAFLTAFNVVLVPFLMAMFFKKTMKLPAVVGAVLSITGIAIMSLNDFNTINIGDVLTLVCALFFALQIIYTNKFVVGENIYVLNTVQMGTAAFLGISVSLFFGEGFVITSSTSILSVLYLGAISTMLAFLLQTASQQFTKGTETAIILSTEAVFGMVFSALFIREAITMRMIIGAVLILAGVLVVEIKPTTSKGMKPRYVKEERNN